jgi:hypothetical protein
VHEGEADKATVDLEMESGLLVGVGVVDGVLHRRDLFRVFVGDLDADFIFRAITSSTVSRESAPRSATKAFSLVT